MDRPISSMVSSMVLAASLTTAVALSVDRVLAKRYL